MALGAGLVIAGCGDDKADRGPAAPITVPKEQLRVETERLRDFACKEVKALAHKTCSAVPREELAKAFSIAGEKANDIALGYVADLDATPIHLQQAAYDGCLIALER